MVILSSARQFARTIYAAVSTRSTGTQIDIRGTDIDRRSTIGPGAFIAHHVSVRDSSIGRRSSVGRFSKISFADIGDFCSISWDVTIGAIMHPIDRPSTHAFPYAARVSLDPDGHVDQFSNAAPDHQRTRIGNDVWLGAGCIILPGVHIADGAVVAAGAVVTRDVPPYSVVAGVPANVLRRRIPDELIERLAATRWWTWSDEALSRCQELFRSTLTHETLSRLEEIGTDPAQPVSE